MLWRRKSVPPGNRISIPRLSTSYPVHYTEGVNPATMSRRIATKYVGNYLWISLLFVKDFPFLSCVITIIFATETTSTITELIDTVIKLQVCVLKFRNGICNNKFWKEIIAYFTLILHGPHGKTMRAKSVRIRCRGNVFTEPLASKDRGLLGIKGDAKADTQTARWTHKPPFISSKYGK
jgi:hypothetical protein